MSQSSYPPLSKAKHTCDIAIEELGRTKTKRQEINKNLIKLLSKRKPCE